MKNILISLFLCLFSLLCNAQGFDEERIAFSNFVERMYLHEPFEGCRIVEDYDCAYLLSVVLLDKNKYSNASAMNRVAQVKSQRNAGEFFNGTQSYSELIIRTPKCKGTKEEGIIETIEEIRVNSTGFVQQMQLLNSFDEEKNKVYIYYKKLGLSNKPD